MWSPATEAPAFQMQCRRPENLKGGLPKWEYEPVDFPEERLAFEYPGAVQGLFPTIKNTEEQVLCGIDNLVESPWHCDPQNGNEEQKVWIFAFLTAA